MAAAIYCRISHDREGGAAGVTRQEADCRALAALRSLEVASVLVDNDVSAYTGADRPAYEQLLDLLRADAVDAVIAWHPDRLHRSPKELEEFIAIIDAHSVDVHTVTAGVVDLSTPIGRMIARQLGTFARYESEHRSERIKAANQHKAKQGRPHKPGAYGYERARDSAGRVTEDGSQQLVPQEAAVVREATQRVLDGQTLARICADFNDRGIQSPGDRRWRSESLRKILLSERVVGLRAHLGEVVGEGRWPALMTMQQQDALRQRLDHRRVQGTERRGHLLSALVICGRCGHPMTDSKGKGAKSPFYICRHIGTKELSCGNVSLNAALLEHHVNAAFGHLGHGVFSALLANPKAFDREVQRRLDIEDRLLEVVELFTRGEISRHEWDAARWTLGIAMGDLPNARQHLGGLRLADPDDLMTEWARLDVDRQRSLLELVVRQVIVAPTAGKKLDVGRIKITFRSDVPWHRSKVADV